MSSLITVKFNRDELRTLIWILDEWRTIQSNTRAQVRYPTPTVTSTKLITKLYEIFKKPLIND